jgi:uncharacterized Zn finger protein
MGVFPKVRDICPRCEQGPIVHVVLRATGETLLVCAECDATWRNESDISPLAFEDFETILEAK